MGSPVRLLEFRRTAGELVRFGMATSLSAIVSLGLPVALHELLHIDQRLAVGIGLVAVLLMNFLTIRRFVFRSSGSARDDVFRYAASAVTFRGVEYGFFLLLFGLAGFFYVTALVITLCTSTLAKFIWYRILFGPRAAPLG